MEEILRRVTSLLAIKVGGNAPAPAFRPLLPTSLPACQQKIRWRFVRLETFNHRNEVQWAVFARAEKQAFKTKGKPARRIKRAFPLVLPALSYAGWSGWSVGCSLGGIASDAFTISSTSFLNSARPVEGMMMVSRRPPTSSVMRRKRPRGFSLSVNTKFFRSIWISPLLSVSSTTGGLGWAYLDAP